ncbi:MAG: hypothetical protein FWE16_04470 [Firmicutes bacterium]|nr:hypothetical protein [Bacillota bacterium]
MTDEKPIPQKDAPRHKLMNICVLAFTDILTVTALVTFFITIFDGYSNSRAHSIAGTYLFCMFLAVPALKVSIDKIKSPFLKKVNIFAVIMIFVTIMVTSVVIFLDLAFPNLF